MYMERVETKPLFSLVGLSAITASMCCLPSVIWVLFAGSSAIVAADSLSNNLYYSWVRFALYGISGLMVTIGLIIYFRNRGICSIEDAKKNSNKIVNISLAVFTASIIVYLIWNFVILEIVGIAIGLPWEDSAFWNS
tara:strand:+ start:154 stop:564 length:411 start_codon:yes stop_codon:yes gene_type:complete